MKIKKVIKEVLPEQKPEKKKQLTQRQLTEEKIKFLEEHDPKSGELIELKEGLVRSKRGRSSKTKGSTYERDIAKIFKETLNIDLVRTPQSGGFAKKSTKANEFRGDITSLDENIDFDLHIECKNQKTWNLKQWLVQASEDCPKGKVPIVVMKKENTNQVGHKGNQQNLVVIDLDDFLRLIDISMIVHQRG